ncbi:MAG: TetR/AcrR family transcriptional regulator [Desulfovibrionaceae bacterium]|nr:TetR/AcrR family transcriptional regulator [Desulfovibrionaceae bacterium]
MIAKSQSTNTQRCKGRPRAFDRDISLRRAMEIFWQKGYEPTSVSELCAAMGINPPSLYSVFGNKASLFIEAIHFYERTYWDAPGRAFLAEPDITCAVSKYFETAAHILLSKETPCGCMIVLAAINISEKETKVIQAIQQLRMATKKMFADRLSTAVKDGQIPPDTDIQALAGTLNTFLEGLSIQARDGLEPSELTSIASFAVRLLPLLPGETP